MIIILIVLHRNIVLPLLHQSMIILQILDSFFTYAQVISILIR